MSLGHTIENTVFSARLKHERQQRKMTQQQLADLCGFSISQINRYEAGDREPSLAGLFKLADVLNISADYLIGLTDNINEQVISVDLGPHERELVDTFRDEGWRGVIRLGAERIAK